MFFEKDKNATVDDPVFEVAPTLKYMTKTRKVLKMQRVFVTPRTEVLGDSEHSDCIPNFETIKQAGVPPKYQEEALAFWAGARGERINALNTYLEKQRLRKEKKAQGIELNSDSDEENPLIFGSVNPEENPRVSESNSNPEMNEFERFLRNTAERPTENYEDQEAGQSSQDQHIFPGPSTSREGISPGKGIPRNRGVVKVLKPARKKNHSKYQRESMKRKRIKPKTEMEASTDNLLREISSILSDSEQTPQETDTSGVLYEDFQPLEDVTESEVEEAEVITDEIQDEQSGHFLSDEYSSMAKRLQKKARREAKMKELAEELKKMSGLSHQDEEEGQEEELII
ncbi:uncharacterized protein LOC117179568 isoform X2 [Belonocnema kinseyi]|nr:uncharacterized protein LOC117179568 isoform X2 [Belonocnema kinseyi]